MPAEKADRHAEYAERLIQQAVYELVKKGDRLQATEKAAGAVAHAVKAVAEDRQWRHSSHHLRRQVMDLVAAEFGKPDFQVLQQRADELHDNYYEDMLDDWQLEERLTAIASLLEDLKEVRTGGPNPGFIPSPAQQRLIDRLKMSEEEARLNAELDFPPPLPPLDLP